MEPARKGESSGRVEISVPKVYAPTDDTVWEELEKYIFTGFLTSHAIIHNQHFVFKTLNLNEVRLIDFMRPYTASSEEKRSHFRAAFIAYSVFMVNGTNSLIDREKNITRLIKIISKFNAAHQEKIFENLTALNEKASRTYQLTEAYSYENRSRFRWMQINSAPLNASINTGIAGTDGLGMNGSQSLWVALNKIYDKKEEMEKDWAHAKFIGSCMAGKGIKAIDDKDKARQERERTEREDAKIKALKGYLNRSTLKDKVPVETVSLPDGRTAEVVGRHRADSAEELAKQLSSALSGEKDAHDLAVEAHFRRIKERQLEIEKERRQLIARAAARPLPEMVATEVISRAEAEQRIQRLRETMLGSDYPITPDLKNSNSDTG